MRVVRVQPKKVAMVRLCAFLIFSYDERLEKESITRCCNLVLDNKPFRFCYSDDYHLQAVRFDIFWDKILGTQSIHTKRLEVQFVQSFLLLSVVAWQ